MDYIERLEQLQNQMKPKCHISIGHQDHFGFYALVQTDGNRYPYWIKYNGGSLREAVNKLFEFFEGKREDHADRKRTAKDFLA